MKYLLILMSLIIVSCSFKSDKDDNKAATRSINELKPSDLKKLDSDGDMINDFQERELGLDRFVANLPKMKINFLQDYSIKVLFDNETQFNIDTKTARDNPDFKYRVGDLFLRENSLDNAAKLGRFSGVSWGIIKQEDFSWVKYPTIDKEFYFSKAREFKYWSTEGKVKSTTIQLENTLKLLESPLYRSIEQLELNFYYYSYSKESYVSLHTQQIDRTFLSGVREDFQISISEPPAELLEDTYFRHGEFIISEIKDFYIPDLKMKYSELLASVKNKTVPVYKTTPFENDLNYVATSKDGDSFINIMEKLYSDKFSIQEDKLFQVEQFSNNLPDFEYLHELSGNDKNGNWFVMTNQIKQHYLKQKFKNTDAITVSYINGNDLSKRVDERIYSLSEDVYSDSTFKKYAIGNVNNNSQISFSVFLKSLKGVQLVSTPGSYFYRPPNCGNCTGTNWSVSAEFVVNSFRTFEQQWFIDELSEINDSIKILINNTELNLAELIERNMATVELREAGGEQYVYYTISKLHGLDIIQSGSENVAFIKLNPLSVGHTGVGLQINKMGGHNIDKVFHAGQICLQEAFKRKIKLATTSWKFSEWQKKVPWGQPDARTGWKPTRGEKQKYWNGIVVDIVSTITNNFN
jgi:hypothetical protein